MFEDKIKEALKIAYEDGLNMAWEAARKLVAMEYWKVNDILSDGVLDIKTDEDIFIRLTASEAIEKLKAWEQKQQEDELCVGDEICTPLEDKAVVICISDDDNRIYYIGAEHAGFIDRNYINARKTGKHYDEIAQLLAKMQEE